MSDFERIAKSVVANRQRDRATNEKRSILEASICKDIANQIHGEIVAPLTQRGFTVWNDKPGSIRFSDQKNRGDWKNLVLLVYHVSVSASIPEIDCNASGQNAAHIKVSFWYDHVGSGVGYGRFTGSGEIAALEYARAKGVSPRLSKAEMNEFLMKVVAVIV